MVPCFYFLAMLSTKFLISSPSQVPDKWIFERYCKLTEKLIGQDVKILSLFNPKDKVPSLVVYYKDGKYKFKDFSNGNGGDGFKLVADLNGISYGEAVIRVMGEYNDFVLDNGDYKIGEFRKHSKYKISEFCKRPWNVLDRDYWMSYGIGSPMLEDYWVFPLSFYKMEKEENNEIKELNISGEYMYGYFRQNGELYKVYQPKIKEKKFINTRDQIQGVEQLKYACPNLLIGSSMKDILCFNQFGWPFEVVAPGSENTMIRKENIEAWRHKYNLMVVLFDNDEPGIKAAKKYHTEYGIATVSLNMEKDISDSVQMHGDQAVMKILHPQLKDLIKCQKL